MKPDITPEILAELLSERGMKQKELCLILNLSAPNISHIMNGNRNVSSSEQKLLKLFFYGEMPFDMLSAREDVRTVLNFTHDEWQVITVLSNREGYTSPKAWVTAQIRGYLRNIEKFKPLQNVAEDASEYGSNITDPSIKQNSTGGEANTRPVS